MRINFIFILLVFASCGAEEKKAPPPKPQITKEVKEELMDANKEWFIQEQAEIDNYVNRHQWKMKTSGTGIRYIIYKPADSINNPRAEAGQIAVVNYVIKTLQSDSVCYESQTSSEYFLIEMDNVESGLHEGIKYMRKGDKALIILPSYLAHGLMGDMDKIPPQSSVLYDIELVDLVAKDEFKFSKYAK